MERAIKRFIVRELVNLKAVAVVSPGLLPIPPVIGGSVETVMQKMAEVTKNKFDINIYGPTNRLLPKEGKQNGINYYRFSAKKYGDYFCSARAHIGERNYSIIQVENRPLFIPNTKVANPKARFICSLHSLDHIAPNLIGPRLTLKIFKQCDLLLVYSNYVKNQLAARFPAVADKIRFVHLATDVDRFVPRWEQETAKKAAGIKAKLGIPANHKVVFFAGRIIPKKGVHILIEAMLQILKTCPKTHLVVSGSGWFGNSVPSQYIKDLKQQAAKLGKRVVFTNYIYPHSLPLYFAMADVFVCPSQWDEPFGLVNVEAMAAGVPVVAAARGGIPEIISDGVDGYLIEDEANPDAYVKPITSLLTNPELAGAFGMKGREKVEQYFNWVRAGNDLIKVYKELLRTKK